MKPIQNNFETKSKNTISKKSINSRNNAEISFLETKLYLTLIFSRFP